MTNKNNYKINGVCGITCNICDVSCMGCPIAREYERERRKAMCLMINDTADISYMPDKEIKERYQPDLIKRKR